MSRETHRITFSQETNMTDVEETLALAVMTVECLHGGPRTRMDISYLVDDKSRTCLVDTSTEAGQDLCLIFTGMAIHEFGKAVKVRRAEAK